MNEKINEIDVIEEKIDFFMDLNKPVHVKLKNGKFVNGKIFHESVGNFIQIKELNGQKSVIFLIEIEDINYYRKRGENGQP